MSEILSINFGPLQSKSLTKKSCMQNTLVKNTLLLETIAENEKRKQKFLAPNRHVNKILIKRASKIIKSPH